tara:strand:- start:39 stop:209 length:171 start_codon:yes stop_codon:yes gene_type:complete
MAYIMGVSILGFYIIIFFRLMMSALFDPDFYTTAEQFNQADSERLFNSAMFLEQDD